MSLEKGRRYRELVNIISSAIANGEDVIGDIDALVDLQRKSNQDDWGEYVDVYARSHGLTGEYLECDVVGIYMNHSGAEEIIESIGRTGIYKSGLRRSIDEFVLKHWPDCADSIIRVMLGYEDGWFAKEVAMCDKNTRKAYRFNRDRIVYELVRFEELKVGDIFAITEEDGPPVAINLNGAIAACAASDPVLSKDGVWGIVSDVMRFYGGGKAMNSLADRIRALPRYAFRAGTTCDEDCHADMYPATGLTAEWVRVADLEVVLSSDNPDVGEELEAARKRIAELETELALWQTIHGGGAEVIPSFTITSDNADEPEWAINPIAKKGSGR